MLTPLSDALPEVFAELLERHERIGRLIESADLRDEVRETAPADLVALGIDRGFLRWAAARAYIRAARAAALERVDSGIRQMILLDRINASWRRRGAPGAGPDESDIVDARLAFQRLFREPAPSLEAIPPSYVRPTTSEHELLQFARDQEAFEAEIDARRREAAA